MFNGFIGRFVVSFCVSWKKNRRLFCWAVEKTGVDGTFVLFLMVFSWFLMVLLVVSLYVFVSLGKRDVLDVVYVGGFAFWMIF